MSLTKIGKYAPVATLIILAVFVFFWGIVEALIPGIKPYQLGGVVISVIAAAILYFDARFEEILSRSRGTITSGTLGECINRLLHVNARVSTLRVHAASSEAIQPQIADKDARIDTCCLLLRRFPVAEAEADDNKKSYNERLEGVIREWRQRVTDGHIGELKIKTISWPPTTYQVIFDDRALLLGPFYRRDDVPAGVEYLRPVIIENLSVDGREMIKSFREAFDLTFRSADEFPQM